MKVCLRRYRAVSGLLILGLWACAFSTRADEKPRVVALAPHLAELVCAAGACDTLVGRVAYTDYPDAVLALPEVGNAFAVNLEALVALQPDLVLAWDGGTSAATTEQLQRVGLNVEAVQVEALDDIAGALRSLGQRLGTETHALSAAAAYERELARLRARYRGLPSVKVFYQIELQPMFSISRRSPIGQAIELCGAENLFADLDGIAAPVNAEAVIARAPEVIVYSDHEDAEALHQWWQRFAAVPAVAKQQLHAVPAELLARATPRMLGGVRALCEAVDRARAAHR